MLTLRGVCIAPSAAAPPVISGVNLVVEPGERIALVGPSGAGKTTLLRTLNGQIPPRSGEVLFEDQNLMDVRGARRLRLRSQIGLVTQAHDLVEPLRVDKNVMAGALGRWSTLHALRFLIWSSSQELAQAEAALQAVGLASKLRQPTAALSGGEQQRVAIARVLIQAPRLLLADEPVASLDPGSARDVLELLRGLTQARGMALICSLHQPELAARYFDRIIQVEAGALIEQPAAGTTGHG